MGEILGSAGVITRSAKTMPASQPAGTDAPAYPGELVAPLHLTGGTTRSTDSIARDAAHSGSDPKPGVALSRMLGDLTRLVGTAAMPAEPGGFWTDADAVFPDDAGLTGDRLTAPTDVAVLRCDAEAPTVSPD